MHGSLVPWAVASSHAMEEKLEVGSTSMARALDPVHNQERAVGESPCGRANRQRAGLWMTTVRYFVS
jgi:hypothetical protein